MRAMKMTMMVMISREWSQRKNKQQHQQDQALKDRAEAVKQFLPEGVATDTATPEQVTSAEQAKAAAEAMQAQQAAIRQALNERAEAVKQFLPEGVALIPQLNPKSPMRSKRWKRKQKKIGKLN